MLTSITFKLTKEQKEEAEKISNEAGMNLATFCRVLLLRETKKEMQNESTR